MSHAPVQCCGICNHSHFIAKSNWFKSELINAEMTIMGKYTLVCCGWGLVNKFSHQIQLDFLL